MLLIPWVNRFMAHYHGAGFDAACQVFYAANRLTLREFRTRFEQFDKRAAPSVIWQWWRDARVSDRPNRTEQARKADMRRAKRKEYYARRRALQTEARNAAIELAKQQGLEARGKALAKGSSLV